MVERAMKTAVTGMNCGDRLSTSNPGVVVAMVLAKKCHLYQRLRRVTSKEQNVDGVEIFYALCCPRLALPPRCFAAHGQTHRAQGKMDLDLRASRFLNRGATRRRAITNAFTGLVGSGTDGSQILTAGLFVSQICVSPCMAALECCRTQGKPNSSPLQHSRFF